MNEFGGSLVSYVLILHDSRWIPKVQREHGA